MEKDTIRVNDYANFISNKKFTKVIGKGEKLYWSGMVIKVNYKNKRQNRTFIITNKRVINLCNIKSKM